MTKTGPNDSRRVVWTPIGVCFFSIRISLILTNNLWHIQLITYEIHVREIGGG